mgnify:CR=1 FL=1
MPRTNIDERLVMMKKKEVFHAERDKQAKLRKLEIAEEEAREKRIAEL